MWLLPTQFKHCPISEEDGCQGVRTRWWAWISPRLTSICCVHKEFAEALVEDAERQEGLSAFVLPCSSLPAWAVSQTLRSEALPFQPAEWWTPSSPTPLIGRAHSIGCSTDTQPRWVCLDSSAPASSQWIRQWFPWPMFVCQLHHLKNEEGILACVYMNDGE